MSTISHDVTLAVFTTLAPAGTLAFALIATLLLDKQMVKASRQRLNHFLVIPLAVVIIGLVASATHLGNPANALYLFRGVGRSPLSTEVFCAVLFLFFGGIYWLQTFADRPRPMLERIWLVLTILTALIFLVSMSLAYSTRTILSWYTAFVPVIMLSNALTAGPILAMFTLRLAGCDLRYSADSTNRSATGSVGNNTSNSTDNNAGDGTDSQTDDQTVRWTDGQSGRRRQNRVSVAMFVTAATAAALSCILTVFQARNLMQLQTAVLSGADLAVWLFAAAAIFFICTACCSLLVATVVFGVFNGRGAAQTARLFAGCILSFAGILALRLAFHAIHMTVGL